MTRLCFVRRDAKTDVFVMPVCQIEGGVKSKAVERGDAFVFPFRERAFAIAKIFSRRNFPVKSVFSKALSFLALKCPQLSFSHDSRRSACSRAKSRDPLAVTPRVTRPIAVPPSGGAEAGHSVVHARAPRRASGRRRRALGLPPGAGSGGAARAKHPPPARVPVGRQGEQGWRDVLILGGAAVETVRPHKQDHLPRRGF